MIGKSFIEELVINHGPTEQLGRFFLRVDSELRNRGVTLRFATFRELAKVNREQRSSWHPMFSSFDADVCNLDNPDAFCLLGFDGKGKVATAQAGRFFDWTGTTMYEELVTLRVLYDDPERDKNPGERIEVSAMATHDITGPCSFLGGMWVRPDLRRANLPALMARLSRAYALARWGIRYNTGLITEPVYKGLMTRRIGSEHIDLSVDLINNGIGTVKTVLVWATAEETVSMTEEFLADFDTIMSDRQHYRRANEN